MEELTKIIMERLINDFRFFEKNISSEYFGVELLHDKSLYQKDLKEKLTAYLDHIIFDYLSSKQSKGGEKNE